MLALVMPTAILLSSRSGAQGRLPDWTQTLVLREDAQPVDRRPNAATNVRLRPAAVSLKVLLAEVADYRAFSAPLGGRVPPAFAEGLTPERAQTSGATQYRRTNAGPPQLREYWTNRAGRVTSMSESSTDTRARVRASFERDLRHLKRRLGFPSAITRNEDRASLILVWRWSQGEALTLTLNAREPNVLTRRLHLGG